MDDLIASNGILFEHCLSKDKLAKTRNNARQLGTAELREKHCRQYWMLQYFWLLSTRLHANRNCLLNLYMPMLDKSGGTVSRECLRWAYFIWLAEGVATILCCSKFVFMLFTISLKRIKRLYFVLLGK